MHRFMGRVGNQLVWQGYLPGDSRVDQIMCDADWFYGTMLRGRTAAPGRG